MSTENNNTEETFEWDAPSTEDAFFGEAEETTTVVEEIENDDIEDKGGEDKGDESNDNPKEEVTFSFEETEEESEEEEDDNESGDASTSDEGEKVTSETSVSTVQYLKDKGLIDYELEEGTEMTSELAEEILEDSIDEKIKDRLTGLFEELPDVVKELNKFAMNGGDVSEFFNKVSSTSTTGISADMDMSVDANKELVVKDQLKTAGYDDEDIATQIEFLKDSGKLDVMADKHFEKWKAQDELNKTAMFKANEEKVKADKANRRKFKNNLTVMLKETEEVNGIKLSKDDKKTLPTYMSDKTVKMSNGTYATQMETDLYSALKDENKRILIAKLIKDDFNFESIKTEATTKVAKKVKEDIRRGKTITPKSATGSSQKNKKESLADFF